MKANKIISILILIIGFALLWIVKDFGPVARLGFASLGLIWLIKLAGFFFERKKFESSFGFALYFLAWPGISTDGFRKRLPSPPKETGTRFFEYWISFLFGSILLCFSVYYGEGKSLALNYLGLFSILFIVHLGLIEVVRDILRLFGFSPNYMFDRPYLAKSLKDFWSFRWNMAFVEMNKIFFVKPFKNKLNGGFLVFLIFAISGLLHEVGISYSSGQDYGLPLMYFLIQGISFVVERKLPLGRIGTILIVLAPFPLLFPPSFVNLYFGLLADSILPIVNGISQAELISLLLFIGGGLQASVLLASIQVPGKLNWKVDLQKLSPFNRKVFWTYGGYIFAVIVFMSVVSFMIGFEGVQGVGSKLWLVFILLFWLARVLVDMFYYSHEDWPKGPEFVIGHICLTTLFVTLVVFYSLSLYLSL